MPLSIKPRGWLHARRGEMPPSIAPPAKSWARKALGRFWEGLKALWGAITLAWAYYFFWSWVCIFVAALLAVIVPPFFGHEPEPHALILLFGAAGLYGMGWAANRIGCVQP